MIELSPEQRQAMAQGQPVRMVDPLTHDAYVVVSAAKYEHLPGAPQRPAGHPHPEIPPMILRSKQTFWRDLPGLLMHRRNHRKWTAYHVTSHANREFAWRVADLSVASVASVAALPKLLLNHGLRIAFRTAHLVAIRRIRRIRRGAMRLTRA